MDTVSIFISGAIWLSGALLALWLAKELAHCEVRSTAEDAVAAEPVKIEGWRK